MDDLAVALNTVQLDSSSQPSSPTSSGMASLPVELILDIFAYCAHQDALSTVLLGHVSARWRAILASAPRLFELVVLDDSRHSPRLANALALYYLSRSDPLPFDVHLTATSRDSIISFLSPFLKHLPRWRSCHVEGVKVQDVRFADFWNEGGGPPRADQLDVYVADGRAYDPVPAGDDMELLLEEEEDAEVTDLAVGMFRLHATPLTSNRLYMDLSCTALPPALHVTPLTFTSLFVTEGTPSLSLRPAELLRFLCACPALEYLQFTGITTEPEIEAADVECPPPIVPLIHLRSLVLHSTLCTRILLSYIHAPNLRELYLEHLNVDWKFNTRNPYLRRRQSSPLLSPPSSAGSSTQFSLPTPPSPQYPFSRASSPMPGDLPMLVIPPPSPTISEASFSHVSFVDLLSPSDLSPASSMPPIRSPVTPITIPAEPSSESIDEDGDSDDEFPDYSQSPYSDHATGMGVRSLIKRSSPPLRVLEMDYADMRTKDFRWLFQRAPALEEFRIVASDMADRVVRLLAPQGQGTHDVLLPRLRALELVNCHRLSGEAILDAVKGRVIVTDSAAREGVREPVPLEDVAIVGCDNFTLGHGQELQGMLGDRLRL